MTATIAKEKPIIFSGPMVRAILGGEKTQTRRVIKPQPHECHNGDLMHKDRLIGSSVPDRSWNHHVYEEAWGVCPYGTPGTRLWVRESAYIAPPNFSEPRDGNKTDREGRTRIVGYAASMCGDSVRCAEDYGVKLTPSIHMPRWASRLTLEITEVRVERLQEISEADCWAEGIDEIDGRFSNATIGDMANRIGCCVDDAKPTFACLWDSINGKRPGLDWQANPWVWVIAFRRLEAS